MRIHVRTILGGVSLFALPLLAACVAVSTSGVSGKKWTGVVAVKESPLVNQVIRESGNDPAIYGMRLRSMLDTGAVEPAVGRYCLIPYDNGRPVDRPECFTTTTGVYTMWAPASYMANGTAMCVQVPAWWPAIAGQLQYPARGGPNVNCRDFGPEASNPLFAATRHTAAMIIVVEPAG